VASIYLIIFTINEEWWIGQILPKKKEKKKKKKKLKVTCT
jgi:hypothetical protein